MYVGLKQPRGDRERYVTPARAAVKETMILPAWVGNHSTRFGLSCPLTELANKIILSPVFLT